MKFIISKDVLLNGLKKVNKIVSSNPIVPILDNVLIEADKDEIRLTTTTMQVTVSVLVYGHCPKTFTALLPSKKIQELLILLPEQPLAFFFDQETWKCEIKADRSSFTVPSENPKDFPKTTEFASEDTTVFTYKFLKTAFSLTKDFASRDEMRPAMNGVLLLTDEHHTELASTDGHRLSVLTSPEFISTKREETIIPRLVCGLFSQWFAGNKEVSFRKQSNYGRFDGENVFVQFRSIDEIFPKYQNVIPLDNTKLFECDKKELIAAVKTANLFANCVTHQVKLNISKEKIFIESEDMDFDSKSNIDIEGKYDGEPIRIGFNAKFLIEAAQSIQCGIVVFELGAPNKAALLKPKEQPENIEQTMLIMPVMLNEYDRY